MSTRYELANVAQRSGPRTVPPGATAHAAGCEAAEHADSHRCMGFRDCIKYQSRFEPPAAQSAGQTVPGARVGVRRTEYARVRTGVNRPEGACLAAPASSVRHGAMTHLEGTAAQRPVRVRPIGAFEWLSEGCRPLAVEGGATLSWRPDVGTDCRVIGPDDFGASDASAQRRALSGFTAERIEREGGERLETAN